MWRSRHGKALPAWWWQVLLFSTLGDGSLSDGGLFPTFSPYDNGENYMYPSFIASADLDGDGFLDLALSGSAQATDSDHFVHFVQVLYGNDAGGFGQPQLIDTTGERLPCGIAALGSVAAPSAVAIADFCGGGITVIGDASRHRARQFSAVSLPSIPAASTFPATLAHRTALAPPEEGHDILSTLKGRCALKTLFVVAAGLAVLLGASASSAKAAIAFNCGWSFCDAGGKDGGGKDGGTTADAGTTSDGGAVFWGRR